jgi:hypothetical protein
MEQFQDNLDSSARELRDFLISSVWRDMRGEMLLWLDDIRSQLEVESNLDVIRKLQGNAEAVNKFLRLPEVLAEALEIEHGRREF